MVSKKVIGTVFDNVIQNTTLKLKCGIGLTLPSSVKRVFDEFHDKYCTDSLEHLIVTDKEGNVLYENTGDEDSVNFPSSTRYELYKEHGQLFVTHNHPRNSMGLAIGEVAECLSYQDIYNLFNYFSNYSSVNNEFMEKSISCESLNGSRMSVVISDEFNVENSSDCVKLSRRLVDYWKDYDRNYYKTFERKLSQYDTDDFDNTEQYVDYCMKETFKEIGVFQKNSEFKDIQREYRAMGVKLLYTFPRPYHVGAI